MPGTYAHVYIYVQAQTCSGDFHFLWECQKVLLMTYWGSRRSLCNIRELIRRVQVDKGGKVFNVCDEFLLHTYKGHLIAAICTELHIDTPETPIEHESTLQWLEATANSIVAHTPCPLILFTTYTVHFYIQHIYLRLAIRFEDGDQIIRHWKWWLPRFLGTGCN